MTHQAAFPLMLNVSLDIRTHAIENPRTTGTTHFGHKTFIDILSGAVRQLVVMFRDGNILAPLKFTSTLNWQNIAPFCKHIFTSIQRNIYLSIIKAIFFQFKLV